MHTALTPCCALLVCCSELLLALFCAAWMVVLTGLSCCLAAVVQVTIKEKKSSFLHFLTNVCAIVGGMFALSGLIDGTVYHAEQVIKKKMELGKHM
jgi:hypothetical protein